jgi:hypothetical protein
MHRAFVSERHERAEYWIRSAIELAVVLLGHRRSMLTTLAPPELKVYERVSGELLSRTIWKYSEARGKFRGNPFWSRKALEHFDEVDRMGEKLFRHEHVFPQNQLIEILRRLEDPKTVQLRSIYEKYAVAVVILKEEDSLLHGSGRARNTVDGGLKNPWLRYKMDQQRILIVENEFIPKWHLENLRAVRLLYRLRGVSSRSRASTGVNRKNREGAEKGRSSREQYYKGPFPSPNTNLRFLVSNNPKVPGTASWVRFDNYFKAKPKTVSEFMAAGGTNADIRYDLFRRYIELDPDPRMMGSDARTKDPSRIESAGRIGPDGYVLDGTSVASKDELFRLLKEWLQASEVSTIGDVGNFGKRPCILIGLDGGLTAVLNADTKRSAVELYVEEVQARGADATWSVIPNRGGRLNKLTFCEDCRETPGWYCYLQRPLVARQEV